MSLSLDLVAAIVKKNPSSVLCLYWASPIASFRADCTVSGRCDAACKVSVVFTTHTDTHTQSTSYSRLKVAGGAEGAGGSHSLAFIQITSISISIISNRAILYYNRSFRVAEKLYI